MEMAEEESGGEVEEEVAYEEDHEGDGVVVRSCEFEGSAHPKDTSRTEIDSVDYGGGC